MFSSSQSISDQDLKSLNQEGSVVPLEKLQKFYADSLELNSSQREADKIAVEERRLKIMKKMLSQLPKKAEIEQKPEEVALPASSTTVLKKRWAKPLFIFLMLFNVLFMAIGGFLGMQEVLADIPGLSVLAANLISACFAMCECAMSYSISGPYVKKGLGIPEEAIERTMTIVQDEQRAVTEAINHILLSPNYYRNMNYFDYQQQVILASLFNKHVSSIKGIEFQEPLDRKRFRWFCGVVNVALIMTNGFYMTTGLLKVVAPVLMGTPVGWGIIAGVIVLLVVSSSIMRSESMYEMLNPEVVQIKEANKKIRSFKDQSEDLKLISRDLLEKMNSSKEFRYSIVTCRGKNAQVLERRWSMPSLLSPTLFNKLDVDVVDVVDVVDDVAQTVRENSQLVPR